jgi:alpha-L-fucosidase
MKCSILFSALLAINLAYADTKTEIKYQPTQASVSQHPLPEWYQDAKFGIMITYGLYSVPAWAPVYNPVGKIFTPEFFLHNPYAEWYRNTMQIKGSPTYEYHLKTYGSTFYYDNFAPLFNQELSKWNPDQWSSLFESAGAKYVVLVTKHHDGFLLWPSQYQNPYKQNWVASRDVVGELTDSVRAHHMRMGIYYSGGFDWAWPVKFHIEPITNLSTAIDRIPQTQEYADYVMHHYHELISKYHPDILWNDIALPSRVKKYQIFADYYNTVPEGVINNRWGQGEKDFTALGQPTDEQVDQQLKYDWFDYYSPEYLEKYAMRKHKWEADHAAGYSFAYNQEEYQQLDHFLTLDQLIDDLADLVSKNGNFLLAIGPKADGTIPDLQLHLLNGMGDWLKKNGEAIFTTRPWNQAEGSAAPGDIPIRYTQSKDGKNLYAILLKNPQGSDILIRNLPSFDKNTKMEILNGEKSIPVSWKMSAEGITVLLSETDHIPKEHPLTLKIMLFLK